MSKYYLSQQDRDALSKLVGGRNDQGRPPLPNTPAMPVRAPETYWALPPCETGIPGADLSLVCQHKTTGEVKKFSPLSGNCLAAMPFVGGEYNDLGIQASTTPVSCCLFHHNPQTGTLDKMLDPVGKPIRVDVHNYYEDQVHGMIQVWKHKDGSWSNERPKVPDAGVSGSTTTSTTTTTIAPSPCGGDCIFTADSSLNWTGPTGGCGPTSTTTSTSTTSTSTSSTTSSGPTSSTAAPTTTPGPACFGTSCRLKCVDTSSTSPPDAYGVTAPYTGYRYQVIEACVDDCECYGEGDPCFLVDGEILSKCLGPDSSTPTSTTTTLPPGATPCELAEIFYGVAGADTLRMAAYPGKPDSWEICNDCGFNSYPIFPLGLPIASIYDTKVVVYSGPCGNDPCSMLRDVREPNEASWAVYSFWGLGAQLAGSIPAELLNYDEFGGGFTFYQPYPKACIPCASGTRPVLSVALQDFDLDEPYVPDGSGNDYLTSIPTEPYQRRRVRFNDDHIEVYIACVPGNDCNDCPFVPFPTTAPPGEITTAAPTTTTAGPSTTTTSTTTTTLPPCSCPKPDFCPTVNGQCTRTTCQRGGVNQPYKPCGSTTTPAPNTCFDGVRWRTCPDCGYYGTTTTSTTSTTPCPVTSVTYKCIGHSQLGGVDFGYWTPISADCCTGYLPEDGAGPVYLHNNILNGVQCNAATCGTTQTATCVLQSTAPPTPACNCSSGSCKFQAYPDSSVPGSNWITGPFVWQLNSSTCQYTNGLEGVPANQEYTADAVRFSPGCCECPLPSLVPTASCDETYTSCRTRTDYQPCCCTTPSPCDQTCIYNSTNGTSWTKIHDPCAPTCPCPGPDRNPSGTCDTLQRRCDPGTPTTSTTSSTTTTTPLPGACCWGGGCSVEVPSRCSALGGTFRGSGTDCTACQGSCCYKYGAPCFDSYEYACTSSGGGVWGGAGTYCTSGSCPSTTTTTTTSTTTTSTSTTTPAPTGACCFPTGGGTYACANSYTSTACAASAGTWHSGVLCVDLGGNRCNTTTPPTTTAPPA